MKHLIWSCIKFIVQRFLFFSFCCKFFKKFRHSHTISFSFLILIFPQFLFTFFKPSLVMVLVFSCLSQFNLYLACFSFYSNLNLVRYILFFGIKFFLTKLQIHLSRFQFIFLLKLLIVLPIQFFGTCF